MVLLDYVANRGLRLPREGTSDAELWARMRSAATRVGVAPQLPGRHAGEIFDDHTPFLRRRRPGDRPDRLRLPGHDGCEDTVDKVIAAQPRRRRRGGARDAAARAALRSRRPADLHWTAMNAPEKLLLAAPRGYCAGVDRAVQTVERALELYGAPVYVRKEIVHNKHVVEQLRERGAVFVEELDDSIPEGAITVFSAHGVSPAVHADAERRSLRTIDATCPLVTKVHREAVKFAAEGYTIVLIGHAGHEEVEGTMGEAPEQSCSSRPTRTSTRSRSRTPTGSPTSPRRRCRSTRRARSSTACASASRTSPGRAPTTSVTPRPTARPPSSRWRRTATSCS